ncbi:MAG: OmpA family protein [bacterium]
MAKALVYIAGLILFTFLLINTIDNKLPAIEAQLASSAEQALEPQSSWAKLHVSGLNLVITGVAPDEAAKNQAMALAAGVNGINEIRFDGTYAQQNKAIAPKPLTTKTAPQKPAKPAANVREHAKTVVPAKPAHTKTNKIIPKPIIAKQTKPKTKLPDCQTQVDQILAKNPTPFGLREAQITRAFAYTLDRVAYVAHYCTNKRLFISVQSGPVGPQSFTNALSQVRAKSIAAYFVQRGIEANRIMIVKQPKKQAVDNQSSQQISIHFYK